MPSRFFSSGDFLLNSPIFVQSFPVCCCSTAIQEQAYHKNTIESMKTVKIVNIARIWYTHKNVRRVGHLNTMEKPYYTAREARAVLGLSDYKFQNEVKAGRIPAKKIPGRKQNIYLKRDIDVLARVMSMAFE